ncbi:MAG: galactokinase [Treponema sp.]|jgi:galactokinase|nr:galactokinase [Treponema sp.]
MLDIGPIHRKEYELDADRSEPVVIAEAPGRVHYLGEHGEPKAGLFLSSAIDRYIRVAVSSRRDSSLRFFAADLGERKRTTLVNLKYKREDRWANHIKVAIQVFAEMGYPVKGLNFTVAGNIPQQVGLASSTAIEVAAAIALKGFFQVSMGEKDLLSRLTASQSLFFGKKTTPIDYIVALHAKKDQFLIVDEVTQEVRRVKSPLSKYKILIMDSRVPRLGVEDELKQRRQDIRKGLELLSHKKQGVNFRDFAAADLIESMGNLPEEIRRRSMHIVQELRRVTEAEEALHKGDAGGLSKIITHSHESLRDLYEVSCPEIDWLVKRAQEINGVLGSRMTGRGFGGCTYTIIREESIPEYKKRLEDYERIFGFHPVIYEVKLSTGSRIAPAGIGQTQKAGAEIQTGSEDQLEKNTVDGVAEVQTESEDQPEKNTVAGGAEVQPGSEDQLEENTVAGVAEVQTESEDQLEENTAEAVAEVQTESEDQPEENTVAGGAEVQTGSEDQPEKNTVAGGAGELAEACPLPNTENL